MDLFKRKRTKCCNGGTFTNQKGQTCCNVCGAGDPKTKLVELDVHGRAPRTAKKRPKDTEG